MCREWIEIRLCIKCIASLLFFQERDDPVGEWGGKDFIQDLDIRVIFNTEAKTYVKHIEKNLGRTYNKRFLFQKTPTEITVIGMTTLITILREEPTVIRILNKETADSFKQYFKELWKVARP